MTVVLYLLDASLKYYLTQVDRGGIIKSFQIKKNHIIKNYVKQKHECCGITQADSWSFFFFFCIGSAAKSSIKMASVKEKAQYVLWNHENICQLSLSEGSEMRMDEILLNFLQGCIEEKVFGSTELILKL